MSKRTTEVPEQPSNEQSGPLTWKPEDKIEITGIEFHALNRVLELFEVGIMAKNNILNRMIKAGIAKRVVPQSMSNPDPNGVEVSQELLPLEEEAVSEPVKEEEAGKIVSINR